MVERAILSHVPNEIRTKYHAYATGRVVEKGIAPAQWTLSVDRHLFLWHLFVSQFYEDNMQFSDWNKWSLSKAAVMKVFETIVKHYGLKRVR